jgi:hypothetical protein
MHVPKIIRFMFLENERSGANKREIRIPPEKPQKGPCQIGRKKARTSSGCQIFQRQCQMFGSALGLCSRYTILVTTHWHI